ncbi:MAG: hypothetical protein HYT68_02000 [Candidatus Zambryskibacteria bacterium]|nr:hypothetical protein [Candidatus Zambryskibacteria bacterium]
METRIVKDKITKDELKELAQEQYGDIIKAVVDVKQEILGVGGELHVDIQSLLIERENSESQKTWGINLYFNKTANDFIEFDSMINLKPALGNKSRSVEDLETQNKIREIVNKLII